MSQVAIDQIDDVEADTLPGTPINADIMEQARNSGERGDIATRFRPGHKPIIKPRGRQKLTGAFIDALTSEFNTRGAQALTELTSKDLIHTCTVVLPKDVLLRLGESDKIQFVINAMPLDESAWRDKHKLLRSDTVEVIDSED